jgi:hypothetical protein
MRLYTACADGCRVLTVNADNEQEAMEALTTLLGDVDGMRVRAATVEECLAWNTSALEARTTHKRSPAGASSQRNFPRRVGCEARETSRRVDPDCAAQFSWDRSNQTAAKRRADLSV